MTEPSEYAPFPYRELVTLAEFHESVAKGHPDRSYLRMVHEERAMHCRNAVASYTALQQRFLEQSMRIRELEAKQAKVA